MESLVRFVGCEERGAMGFLGSKPTTTRRAGGYQADSRQELGAKYRGL